MGYSFLLLLAARVLIYAPSHRQDSTYHGLCYTSRGELAGTRNSLSKCCHAIRRTNWQPNGRWLWHSLQTVVVELVVAGQSDESAPARRQREEHLHRRIAPHLHRDRSLTTHSTHCYTMIASLHTYTNRDRSLTTHSTHCYTKIASLHTYTEIGH